MSGMSTRRKDVPIIIASISAHIRHYALLSAGLVTGRAPNTREILGAHVGGVLALALFLLKVELRLEVSHGLGQARHCSRLIPELLFGLIANLGASVVNLGDRSKDRLSRFSRGTGIVGFGFSIDDSVDIFSIIEGVPECSDLSLQSLTIVQSAEHSRPSVLQFRLDQGDTPSCPLELVLPFGRLGTEPFHLLHKYIQVLTGLFCVLAAIAGGACFFIRTSGSFRVSLLHESTTPPGRRMYRICTRTVSSLFQLFPR
mmetsp:Transcript_40886/g.123259  ORF Transcript_40886/g.123259 Transcript_40886/m.123259 type:complete len:257 (-) Transcript_40886:3215-3985(-)